jgi:hypothetical protein
VSKKNRHGERDEAKTQRVFGDIDRGNNHEDDAEHGPNLEAPPLQPREAA